MVSPTGAVATSAPRRGVSPRRLFVLVLVSVFGLLGQGSALRAKDARDLEIALTAQQVVRDAAGVETLKDHAAVEPGQLVQYTATYHNRSVLPLRNLAPTLPIPAGMEFVPGSASPAPQLASLDGKNFEPYPIRHTHRLADGREVIVEVPASAYRALRWAAGELAPGFTLVTTARARVATTVVSLP